jgi:hypothetical protein
MWSGIEHCVVWYMVMNVLEQDSVSVFTGRQYDLIETSVPTSQATQSDNSKTIILNLNILHFSCIVSLTQQLNTHNRQ